MHQKNQQQNFCKGLLQVSRQWFPTKSKTVNNQNETLENLVITQFLYTYNNTHHTTKGTANCSTLRISLILNKSYKIRTCS